MFLILRLLNELNGALDALSKDLRAALELAADRIHSFHEKQLPRDFAYQDHAGVELGMRYTPVDSVGLYVPVVRLPTHHPF